MNAPCLNTVARVSALAAVLVVSGCAGDTTDPDGPSAGTHIGNPGSLGFRTSALESVGSPESQVVSDPDGIDFHLTEVRVGIRDVELDLPLGVACAELEADIVGGRCSDIERKIIFSGPFVADLLTGETTPSLDAARIPALAYPRIDYRIDDVSGLEAGDPLAGNSFLARADFEANDGALMELLIVLDFSEDIRIENAAGVALPPDGTLTVAFDTTGWLSGLPIARCVDDGELRIEGDRAVIDEDADDCGDAENTIRDNIERSPRLVFSP